jgi:hypothetical protein
VVDESFACWLVICPTEAVDKQRTYMVRSTRMVGDLDDSAVEAAFLYSLLARNLGDCRCMVDTLNFFKVLTSIAAEQIT